MSVDDARLELSKNADLAAVIKAAEAADAGALMGLAKRTPPGVCDRYRTVPEGCSSRDDPVEGVYQDCGEVCQRPITLVEGWISQTLKNGPVTLSFAARDDRLPEGDGGEYYLVFQAAQPGSFEGMSGIMLVVHPGQAGAIEIVGFTEPGLSGLAWAQFYISRAGSEGSPGAEHLALMAPETVRTWRDIQDSTEALTVVRPEYVTPSPSPGIPDGAHPLGTKVAIPAVDSFLDAAYAGDLSELAKNAVFVPVGCFNSTNFPPCDPGDLPNTPYDVVGVWNCDRHWVRSVSQLEEALDLIDEEGPQYLLMVLAPRDEPRPYADGPGYYMVGLRSSTYPGRVFYLDEKGRLLKVESCPYSSPLWRMQVPSEVIVLPPR
jgi:hypothetical protein